MANTSNLDLVKPAGTDHALISVINSNMDKVDAYAGKVNTSLAGVEDGLAIVATGNTHAAITAGQFVYVKEHNTLPEGLYTANSNIAANATLSTTNLTADSKGGLNALSDQIANIDNWEVKKSVSGSTEFETEFKSSNSSATINVNESIRMVYIDCWAYNVRQLDANSTYTVISSSILPAAYKPKYYNAVSVAFTEVSGAMKKSYAYYSKDNNTINIAPQENIPANNYNRIIIQYIY